MRILAKHCSLDTLRIAYYGTVYSLLKFNIIFWGNSTNISLLFTNQKVALRIITKSPPLTTCRNAFRNNDLLTLPAISIFEHILFLKRNPNLFERFLVNHSHNTRGSQNQYNLPQHKLTLTEKQCTYFSIKCFNTLPRKLRETQGLGKFKKDLFNLLVFIEPYNFEEFFQKVQRS